MSRVKVPPNKLFRICNGVDSSRFRPVSSPGGRIKKRFVIGTVSRLEPIKGVISIIMIASLLRDNCKGSEIRYEFVIVGDGALRSELERLVVSLSLTQWVSFTGESSEPADWYPKFDIFLLTSNAEGISNTVLEAMACGLPIIATDVGGNTELVEEGVNGYLFSVGDIDGMAGQIEDYANDSGKRTDHGKSSRARALEYFSIDGMTSSYTQLYREGECPQCAVFQE